VNSELAKNYYQLNSKLEKIKVAIFKHINEPNFLDCVDFIMRDVCALLEFEKYSLNLRYGKESGTDKVIEDW
jgi:hypothetical protein